MKCFAVALFFVPDLRVGDAAVQLGVFNSMGLLGCGGSCL